MLGMPPGIPAVPPFSMNSSPPFWQNRTLADFTLAEWESLCDGCGKCCLHKLEDVDTGQLFHTNVACRPVSYTHLDVYKRQSPTPLTPAISCVSRQ